MGLSRFRKRSDITSSDRFIYWLAVPLVLVLLVYIVIPMIATATTSLENGGAAYSGFLSGSSSRALGLSVGISVVSVLTTGIIGTALAVLLTRFDFPGRNALRIFAMLPMALPPLIGAVSFYFLYSESGILPRFLSQYFGMDAASISANGVMGVILVHTMTMYPYFYLAVSSGLAGSDASMEEAALNLGASRFRLWRTVLLPMLTPALVSGALLTFMVSMASFTAPQFYNVQTLTMQIVSSRTSGDYPLAASQSVVLSLVSILFLLGMRWYEGRRLHRGASKGTPQAIRVIHGFLPRLSAGVGSLILVIILMAPAATIALLAFTVDGSWTIQILPPEYTWDNFARIFTDPATLRPILVSTQMAFLAMIGCVLVGVIASWVVTRWKGPGKAVLDVMVMIPWALPGTVIGVNLVTAFASPSPFNLGQVLIGSLWILPVAYFVRFLPLVFRSANAALAQIDPSVEEAARSLGAGPWRALRTVTVPLMYRGILAGALMAFIQGFGEYVASVVVYPARFAPLSVEIYNRIYSNQFGTAAAYGTLQMIAILIVLIVSQRLEKPRGLRRRPRRTTIDGTPAVSAPVVPVSAPLAGAGTAAPANAAQ
ncbi:ABC transporter permease [Mycetocola spongiae]|uniref:ABC transporter permease n=1 Tax=Mycetocola spongiae TaxID=2859226 RepID=UPI001CF3C39A|nr:iron ABC transporter permease [Mycetocola spongiae]